MKKFLLIVAALLSLSLIADDRKTNYVDDIYYSAEVELQQQIDVGQLKPYYNKKHMVPFVFTEDSVPAPQDTVCVVP